MRRRTPAAIAAALVITLLVAVGCSSSHPSTHPTPSPHATPSKPTVGLGLGGPSKADARKALRSLKPLHPNLLGTTPVTYSTTTDQWGSDKDQKLDVYAPNDTKSHPALLFVHGGGWVADTIDTWSLALFQGVCRNNNWICGMAYYPTYSVGGQSVSASELSAVTTDLNELRAQPHVNTAKVAVYGESAGGDLGGVVAYQNPTKVAAVVTSSGPTNMISEEQSTYNQPGLDIAADVDYFEGETYAASSQTNPYDFQYPLTSPVSFVATGSPPTFAYADGQDTIVPALMYVEFQSVLNRWSVRNKVVVMTGTQHCPDSQVPTTAPYTPANTESAMQLGIDFINSVEGN